MSEGALEQNTTMIANLIGTISTLIEQLRGNYGGPSHRMTPPFDAIKPEAPSVPPAAEKPAAPKRGTRKPAAPDAAQAVSAAETVTATATIVDFDAAETDDFLSEVPTPAPVAQAKPLTLADVRKALVDLNDNAKGWEILKSAGKAEKLGDLKPEFFAVVIAAAKGAK